MADELVGKRIADRFTITRVLGQGGMATVYAASQEQEPRELALKIMSRSLSADPRFAKRFEREAQAAQRVQHPNSVRIYSYGVAGKDSYIAMELLSGVDLAALLDRDTISQRRAVNILAEICDVLAVAHELGVVHRDLKPENVMIVPDAAAPSGERVKVLDFGIAKMLFEDGSAELPPDSDEAPTALTRTGTQLGTPAYMSPEQCQLLEVDARSDLYTCGILLYQMMTGGVPYEGETPLHTATLHIREPLVKPSTYAPHLDLRLEAIIVKALEKQKENRHASARALAAELRALSSSLPDKPARLGGPPRSRKSGPHSPRRSAPPPAAGQAASRPLSTPPLPMFGGRPMPVQTFDDEPSSDDARTVMKVSDEDTDDARTMMKVSDEDTDRARTMLRESPEAAGTRAPRRGTELLDLGAPLASPSAPRAPPPEPPRGSTLASPQAAPPFSPPLSPGFVLAEPRHARPQGPSGIAALLLGFLVGVVVIAVGLAVYLFVFQR
jgi:eukaryotic-like serine/threonine-protein kinase